MQQATRIHLDTDLGGDTDDLCALATLLSWPGVEVAGITTSADPGGLRAGLAVHALALAGRSGVPVAAGAADSLAGFRYPAMVTDPERYWGQPVAARPGPPGAALDLLARSIDAGAAVLAIGPYTNLAMLEAARPGLLRSTDLVVMGGYVGPPRPGLPQWGPEYDYNVQQDTQAARVVFERCNPLVVPLGVTLEVTLRAACLPRLRAAGPLGSLMAAQAQLHGEESRMPELGRRYQGLPDDLLNFQYDPLAAAVAAGWDGVEIGTLPLAPRVEGGLLRLSVEPEGTPTRVVTAVDGDRFAHEWLDTVAPP